MDELKELLTLIELYDEAYDRRYGLVLDAMALAHRLKLQAGVRIDPEDTEWPVAFIELPTGQVSWHIPPHPVEWDGHTTEEKYNRIRGFVHA